MAASCGGRKAAAHVQGRPPTTLSARFSDLLFFLLSPDRAEKPHKSPQPLLKKIVEPAR